MQKENKAPSDTHQYVGPYRLEKTLGKGQTGKYFNLLQRLNKYVQLNLKSHTESPQI